MKVFESPLGGGGVPLFAALEGDAPVPAPLAMAASRDVHGVAAPVAEAAGVGVSVGTARVVAASIEPDGGVALRAERNAFVDLEDDPATRRFLAGLDVPAAERGGRLVVVGDAAFDVARLLKRETRRPMKAGLVSPEEPDALFRLVSLFERTVGRASVADERAAFSVPSESARGGDPRFIYHRGILESALARLGYRPLAVSEGLAVVMSELSDSAFTGVGVSFGAGRTNVSIAYRGLEVDGFSVERGGDWVDAHAATALGVTTVDAAAAKEGGVDLLAPAGRTETAVATLLKNWIGVVVEAIRDRLAALDRVLDPRSPLALVASGGAALARGFTDVMDREIERVGGLGIPVARVCVAASPLESVARGCLVAASLAGE